MPSGRSEKVMRLGKFEKWILVNCYRKTILRELPEDWKTPREYPRKRPGEFHAQYLFKSEVMLNYFSGLKPSATESFFPDVVEKFQSTKQYRSALAMYRNTANRLEAAKGYIREYTGQGGRYWTGIVLTEAGIEKARELLNREE